jgi:hypothetical protein
MADNRLEYILDLSPEQFKKKLKDAGVDVSKLDDKIEQAGKTGRKSFSDMLGSFTNFTVGLNQGIELITKFAGGLKTVNDATVSFDKNTTLIQKRLKTTREEAEKLNTGFKALAKTFNVDFNQEIIAATALQKEFNLTAQQTFDILEKAGEKVPDQFGEILEVTREYSSQLAQIGVSADQFLAISTQAIQQGVFSDKGIDAIKEFNLSFREGTEATRKAFTGLGLDFEQFQRDVSNGSKTVFDVLTETSNKLNELGINAPETGTALADIFRGAGEDAGAFILEIGKLEKSLDNVETQISDSQKAQLEFNKQLENFSQILIKNAAPALKFITENFGGFLGFIGSEFDRLNIEDNANDLISSLGDIEGSIDDFTKSKSPKELTDLLFDINKALTVTASGSRKDLLLDALRAVNSELSSQKSANAKSFFSNIIEGAKEFFNSFEKSKIDEAKKNLQSIFEPDDEEDEEETKLFNIQKEIDSELERIAIIDEAEKALFDAQIARAQELQAQRTKDLQEYASIAQSSFGVLFNSWITEGNNFFKAFGESARSAVIGVIDMYAKAEIAKLTFASFSTFGASLAGILPILAALEAAKAGLNAIKFAEGGGMTTGASHEQGGTKFVTRNEPGVIKEYEGSEYIFSKDTVSRLGKRALDAINFGGANVMLYENGGSFSRASQPVTSQVQPSINLGDQNITLEVDGKEIASLVNIRNNDSRNSGQILTENT